MRLRRHTGFTLVEVLISVIILAVGLLALSQLYVTGMYTYQKARNMSLATQRASREMERAQNFTFTLINSAHSQNKIVPDLYPAPEYTAFADPNDADLKGVNFDVPELPEGVGTVIFSHFYDNTQGKEMPNLLQVDVLIEWGGKPNTQTPIHLVTLIANK
jgi:prepilin-type N-terminal cleavage/methylation domain-containing protein